MRLLDVVSVSWVCHMSKVGWTSSRTVFPLLLLLLLVVVTEEESVESDSSSSGDADGFRSTF